MTNLLAWAGAFATLCFTAGMGCAAIRLLKGPSAQDRVLALEVFYSNAMLLLVVLGVRLGSTLYFEIALLIALFGFVGTAAMAKFLLRGEVIEP